MPATTRPCAGRITTLIRSQAPIAARRELRYDSIPRDIRLRVTVQQDNNRGIDRPSIMDIEDEVAALKPLHVVIMCHTNAGERQPARCLIPSLTKTARKSTKSPPML